MAIYRKGEGQMDADGKHTELRNAAVQQRIDEFTANRGSAADVYKREVASGEQGARNVVGGVTVAQATANPEMLGGPVSGSAMARLKDIKSEKKRTAAKEMKRR
jgi:hypothetical protein